MADVSAIGRLASQRTREEFAAELAQHTTLTAPEIAALFPERTDQEEFLELLNIVSAAADDNVKKAKLIERIGTVGGAVIKITKRFATGLG